MISSSRACECMATRMHLRKVGLGKIGFRKLGFDTFLSLISAVGRAHPGASLSARRCTSRHTVLWCHFLHIHCKTPSLLVRVATFGKGVRKALRERKFTKTNLHSRWRNLDNRETSRTMSKDDVTDRALIIGLSGPSSSGKTTLARLLRTTFNIPASETTNGRSIKLFIFHQDDTYKTDTEFVSRHAM